MKMKMNPAGHGGASGRYDRLEDQAFEYAWILSQVGLAEIPASSSADLQ
jgi:oligopeptidase B